MRERKGKKLVSGVGFEPTPSIEDQKSLLIPYRGIRHGLESGALDHSANLTVFQAVLKFPVTAVGNNRNWSAARL